MVLPPFLFLSGTIALAVPHHFYRCRPNADPCFGVPRVRTVLRAPQVVISAPSSVCGGLSGSSLHWGAAVCGSFRPSCTSVLSGGAFYRSQPPIVTGVACRVGSAPVVPGQPTWPMAQRGGHRKANEKAGRMCPPTEAIAPRSGDGSWRANGLGPGCPQPGVGRGLPFLLGQP